jgi:DNA-binding transcriptional LysR family regulator
MRLNATLKHLGISLLPSYVSDHAIHAGKLVRLLPDWTIEGPYQGHVYIQYVRSNHMPLKVRTFIDYMINVFNPD